MQKEIITSGKAPTTGFTAGQATSPLAQAIRMGGLLFVSGQGPLDPETRTVVDGDITVQTRRTLDNLRNVLDAGGADFTRVANMRVMLRHAEDFSAFNDTFRDYMQGEKVTRTCIVATPHRPGVNVEIDCIAVLDQPGGAA